MVRFYDPIDQVDQKRIERLLHDGGIEYFLHNEPESRLHTSQILVAEEDIPRAEKLLGRTRH